MSNNLIPSSSKLELKNHYTSYDIYWPGFVSLILSAIAIVYGLRWNTKNILKLKGSIFGWFFSICVYSFSLLSWLTLVLVWAEWSIVLLVGAIVLGGSAISAAQQRPFGYDPISFGFLSAILPVVTLPSVQRRTKIKFSQSFSTEVEDNPEAQHLTFSVEPNHLNSEASSASKEQPEKQYIEIVNWPYSVLQRSMRSFLGTGREERKKEQQQENGKESLKQKLPLLECKKVTTSTETDKKQDEMPGNANLRTSCIEKLFCLKLNQF
jgi:hypothetical protein